MNAASLKGGEQLPWQTDTCIGSWHYQRSVYNDHKYKSARQVVQMLIDIVSKNGNLMLNIPVRGDGTIDDDEVKVLEGLASWIGPNGEAIYATRPFAVYGEGPSVDNPQPKNRFGGAQDVRPYTAKDFRFTQKGDAVYAFLMQGPDDGNRAEIKSLAKGQRPLPQRNRPRRTPRPHANAARVHAHRRRPHRHPPQREAKRLRERTKSHACLVLKNWPLGGVSDADSVPCATGVPPVLPMPRGHATT